MAATTAVSGLVAAGVLSGAGTAVADVSPQTQGGAAATINGLKVYGEAVIHADGGDQRVDAGLFEMSVDGGGTLQTYCVDLHNPTQRDARYQETPWSGTSLGANKDAAKIHWILQHSYPQVNDLASLARQAGVGALSEQDAAAGTQVAIWRYSDGAAVDAVDPQAEKLADYLEKSARNSGEPQASLTLDPPAISGRPGDLLGPLTVHTNAGAATVVPPADADTSGVRIIDATGKVVTSVRDGSRVYFDIPEDAADGTADLTLQASTTVPVGRAFASESRSQTQILAGSSESTVSATATATWAAKGAVPAVSARKNCAEGGVDIIAAKQGRPAVHLRADGRRAHHPRGCLPHGDRPAPGGPGLRLHGHRPERPQPPLHRCPGLQDAGHPHDPDRRGPQPAQPRHGGRCRPGHHRPGRHRWLGDHPADRGVAIGLVVIGGAVLVLLRNREQPLD